MRTSAGYLAAPVAMLTIRPKPRAAMPSSVAFINSIGAFAGFVGPSMVGILKEATGSFTVGVLAMALILVVSALLTASLRWLVNRE